MSLALVNTICESDSTALSVDTEFTIIWNDSLGNDNPLIVSPSTATSYSYTTEGENTCETGNSITVEVDICTDILDNNKETDFSIYPNPCSSVLHIASKWEEDATLVIYNEQGAEVLRKKIESYTSEIDVPHLQDGIYFMKCQSEGEIYFQERVLIQK